MKTTFIKSLVAVAICLADLPTLPAAEWVRYYPEGATVVQGCFLQMTADAEEVVALCLFCC